MNNVDLVIIGGGPAGLAAAVAARKAGVEYQREQSFVIGF